MEAGKGERIGRPGGGRKQGVDKGSHGGGRWDRAGGDFLILKKNNSESYLEVHFYIYFFLAKLLLVFVMYFFFDLRPPGSLGCG